MAGMPAMLVLPYGGHANALRPPPSGKMILKRIGSSIDRNPASLVWPVRHNVTPPHWPVCPYQTAHVLGIALALAPEVACGRLGMLYWRGEQPGERRGSEKGDWAKGQVDEGARDWLAETTRLGVARADCACVVDRSGVDAGSATA